MLTKKERMEQLSKAGINTNKYFSVDLDNGTKIHLIIDENGDCRQIKNDPIYNEIIEDGYVRNSKLHRRFVMAQMFRFLNYKSRNGYDSGFHACLRERYGYDYTFKMMLEEVRVLSKIEGKDSETFAERASFFTKEVVVSVMNDYMEKLKAYIDNLPERKCKRIPYKRIKGQNIFVEDIQKKVYNPLDREIRRMKSVYNYTQMYACLYRFMRIMIKLPYDTPKSKVWIDAFKGNGSYYTLKNLVMFHNCYIQEHKYRDKMYGSDAVKCLESKRKLYAGEGWRMMALLKKVVEDNGINTETYIREICNK